MIVQSKNTNNQKRLNSPLILLCLYLSISIIYWVPGVSSSIIKFLKITLISFTLILFFFANKFNKIFFPYQLFIPLIIIFFLFIPFSVVSVSNGKEFKDVFLYYINIPFGFLTALIAYNNLQKVYLYSNFIKIPFLIVSTLCVFPITNFIFGFPNWVSPFTLESGNMLDVFWSTGFNASRTGWSGSLACFIPLAIIFLVKKENKLGFKHFLIFLGIIIPILGAQMVSLGRGGMLASLISIFILVIIHFGKKGMIAMFILLIVTFFTFQQEIMLALRITDIEGNIQNIDDISSVRNQMNKEAIPIILNKPLFGHGFEGNIGVLFKKGGANFEGLEIHNTFLNLFADYGLIMGLTLFFISLYAIKISVQILRKKESLIFFHATSCIIISGLIVSLFEPHAIFTSYQQAPFWWMSLGFNIKYINNNLSIINQ